MTEIRIVEYCGNNTFTEGWEKVYDIQPMQAFGNSDFAEDEVDDFVEVIETEISENEALDLDGDIVREFGDRLRSMLEGENDIGVLTLERKELPFLVERIREEAYLQGLDMETLDPNGSAVDDWIIWRVLEGQSVTDAVADWAEWKKQDLEEREEDDAE